MQFTQIDFNKQYNIEEIIFILETIFGYSIEDICEDADVQLDALMKQDKEALNKLFEYTFKKDININDIIWQLYSDEYNSSQNRILAHGSRSGIQGKLRLDKSGDSNDFANGFYCGETIDQASMFVANEPNSSLYLLKLNSRRLRVARFNVTTDWLLTVAYYRDTLNNYENYPKMQRIINKINNCDYIIAPIADNKMFELIDLFIQGKITDNQCKYSMSTSYLGYQYVFKTQKALDNLQIVDHCFLSDTEKGIYIKMAEQENNVSLNKVLFAKRKYDDNGKYIDELLKDK